MLTRKILPWFSVILLSLAFILSGCGGDKSNSPSVNVTSQPAASIGSTSTNSVSSTTSSSPAPQSTSPAGNTPAETSAADGSSPDLSGPDPSGALDTSAAVDLTALMKKAQQITTVKFQSPGILGETDTFWVKGDMRRLDIPKNVLGPGETLIAYKDPQQSGDYIIHYTPGSTTAVKKSENIGGESIYQPSDYARRILNMSTPPKVLGTQMVDNKKCVVIEYKDDLGMGITNREWIWLDYGVLLRAKSTQEDGTVSVAVTMNWDFSDISDDVFKLPAGVQLTDEGATDEGTTDEE